MMGAWLLTGTIVGDYLTDMGGGGAPMPVSPDQAHCVCGAASMAGNGGLPLSIVTPDIALRCGP